MAAQTDSVALVMSGFKASCDLASDPRLCSFHPFLESQGPESQVPGMASRSSGLWLCCEGREIGPAGPGPFCHTTFYRTSVGCAFIKTVTCYRDLQRIEMREPFFNFFLSQRLDWKRESSGSTQEVQLTEDKKYYLPTTLPSTSPRPEREFVDLRCS